MKDDVLVSHRRIVLSCEAMHQIRQPPPPDPNTLTLEGCGAMLVTVPSWPVRVYSGLDQSFISHTLMLASWLPEITQLPSAFQSHTVT